MTTVRRETVTTVREQTRGGGLGSPAQLDNTLDALLEDLQTSVARPSLTSTPLVNGVTTKYHEVKHTVERDGIASSEDKEYRVQYISAANPITVIPESDAKLKQNLNELDNLLVDLHKAQNAGFSGVATTRSGIDPSLLEAVDQGTTVSHSRQPAQPIPKRSSSTQRELLYGTIETGHVRTGRSPSPATPQRSTARRDITTSGGSRYRDKSPTNRRLQKELLTEKDDINSPGGGSRIVHSYSYSSDPSGRRSPSPSRPYGGSKVTTTFRTYNYSNSASGPPSHQDTARSYEQREKRSPSPTTNYQQSIGQPSKNTNVHTYNYSTGQSPKSYNDTHIIEPRRSTSPSSRYPQSSGTPPSSKITHTTVRNYTTNTSDNTIPPFPNTIEKQSPLTYPESQQPGSTKITTVRTYNTQYTTNSNVPSYPDSSQPHFETKSSPSPSPLYPQSSPQPGGTKVTTVRTYNYSTNVSGSPSPANPDIYIEREPKRSPSPALGYAHPPPQSKITTVRTYNYEHPKPPEERPLTYQVSPPRDGPTNITYKYTTHHTTHQNKYPGQPPEDTHPLLPRPFPTDDSIDGRPPKGLDDLMASFSDTEVISHEHEEIREPPYKRTSANAPPDAGNAVIVTPKPAPVVESPVQQRAPTKNIAGPPVYYPPGVELFAKKDDPSSNQLSSSKPSWKDEAARQNQSKGASDGAGVALVPIPLCCGMACTLL